MKKISETAIIAGALVISGGLIAGLATAGSYPSHNGFGHHGHHGDHGKIDALKLDANKDGTLSKKEMLRHNSKRFMRLDSDENGSISKDKFNPRLVAMFEKMDSDGDCLLNATQMPKRHHGGHRRHDYDGNYDYSRG